MTAANVKGWTAGPWFVGETLRAEALAVIGDGDSVVCEFPDRLGASVDADATLIAAAPDLYEALVDLEVCANTAGYCYTRNPGNFAFALRELRDSAERARAALSRATGAATKGDEA